MSDDDWNGDDREEEMLWRLAESLRDESQDDGPQVAETLMLDAPPEEVFYNATDSLEESGLRTNTTHEIIRMEDGSSHLASDHMEERESKEEDKDPTSSDSDLADTHPSVGSALRRDSFELNVDTAPSLKDS